jgi:hypothetical protein
MSANELKEDIINNPKIYTPVLVEGMKKYFKEFCK